MKQPVLYYHISVIHINGEWLVICELDPFLMMMVMFCFCFYFLLGLKTFLISGRKVEHDDQCGCSQTGLPVGDFAAFGLSCCPQPHTPDLIPGGALAAEPLLAHHPPDRTGVRVKVNKRCCCSSLLCSWKFKNVSFHSEKNWWISVFFPQNHMVCDYVYFRGAEDCSV